MISLIIAKSTVEYRKGNNSLSFVVIVPFHFDDHDIHLHIMNSIDNSVVSCYVT